MRQMKRPVAILAVFAVFASAALPELSAGLPQGNLPACCLQNGKHMCMAMRSNRPGSRRAPDAPELAALCPLWGQTRQVAVTQRPVPNLIRFTEFSALNQQARAFAFARSAVSPAPSRNISQRGP